MVPDARAAGGQPPPAGGRAPASDRSDLALRLGRVGRVADLVAAVRAVPAGRALEVVVTRRAAGAAGAGLAPRRGLRAGCRTARPDERCTDEPGDDERDDREGPRR